MRRNRLGFLVLLVSLAGSSAGAARPISEIPRPHTGAWVVDLAGTLAQSHHAELNLLGDRLEAERRGELAIVVVASLDGAESRRFALNLFNRWGRGGVLSDKGLLILAALQDRAAEIVLGDSVDGAAQQRASDAIMREILEPRFRAAESSLALVAGGGHAVAERILAIAEPGAQSPNTQRNTASAAVESPDAPSSGQRRVAIAVVVSLAILASLPPGYLLFLFWRDRRETRLCTDCRTPRTLLSEAEEDLYLSAGEQKEEELGSMNHEVWFCTGCGSTSVIHRTHWFSRYRRCALCNARAATSSSRTLRAASSSNGGIVEVRWECANCRQSQVSHRFTPTVDDSWIDLDVDIGD